MTGADPGSGTGQALAASLRTVPETRLHLIELAWELANPQGQVDELKTIPRMDEIRDACQQAAHYGEATKRLAWSLRQCLPDPYPP